MPRGISVRLRQRFQFPKHPVSVWTGLRFQEDVDTPIIRKGYRGRVIEANRKAVGLGHYAMFDPSKMRPILLVRWVADRWMVVELIEGEDWTVSVTPSWHVGEMCKLVHGLIDPDLAMAWADEWAARRQRAALEGEEFGKGQENLGSIVERTKLGDWVGLEPFRLGCSAGRMEFGLGLGCSWWRSLGRIETERGTDGVWRWRHLIRARVRWRAGSWEAQHLGDLSAVPVVKARWSHWYPTEEFAARMEANDDLGAYWGDGAPWRRVIERAAQHYRLVDRPSAATIEEAPINRTKGVDEIEW